MTPAHDINDYNLGVKYGLEVIDTINDDGTMSAAARFMSGKTGLWFAKDRQGSQKHPVILSRRKITGIRSASASGLTPSSSRNCRCSGSSGWSRCRSRPWTMCLTATSSSSRKVHQYLPALDGNVRDWCISRQLWWEQRIPAWYSPDGTDFVVCKTETEAIRLF